MNRESVFVALLLVVCCQASAFGQQALIDYDTGMSMFSDNRGYQVGDVITIIIRENTVASSNARTATDARNDLNGGGSGALDFIPLFGLDAEGRYEGDGQTERQGQIRTEITARIVEVLPNGQYKIEGKREMKINGETEVVVLTGVIRGRDINPENRVLSAQIADASISYQGRGIVDSAQRPGWVTRIVNWIF